MGLSTQGTNACSASADGTCRVWRIEEAICIFELPGDKRVACCNFSADGRMIITGDPSQIDLLNARDSGLPHALRILEGVKGVGVLKFAASDVVRHAMVERIVKAYDADAARSRPGPDLEDAG